MIGRVKLSRALVASHGPYADKLDPLSVAEMHGHRNVDSISSFFTRLLLQDDAPKSLVAAARKTAQQAAGQDQQARTFVSCLAASPEYQLA